MLEVWEVLEKKILIKKTLKKAKTDIVMIQETKLELVDQRWIRSIWGFRNKKWVYLPSFGASGGQLIIWKEELFEHLETLPGAYTFSIKFKNKKDGFVWCLTYLYGPVRPFEREVFWLEN